MKKLINLTKNANKQKKKKKGFTLVELIVVITILAILGTIAFISLQSYSINARNGARIADINNIKKNLELFAVDKGYYPTPDGGNGITYKGGLAWTQGTIGGNVITNLKNISKKPVDPLTGNEYTYSLTNLKSEYQLGSIYEGGIMLTNNNEKILTNNKTEKISIIPQTNAANAEKKALSMITGNYNGIVLKVSTGTVDYILAVPSIINSNLNDLDLVSIINNKTLAYEKFSNLPSSYKDMGYTMTGGFDFVAMDNIEIYSGSIDTLREESNKIVFIKNIQDVYKGSILQGNEDYKAIVNLDITGNQGQAIALVNNYLNRNIGGIPGGDLIVQGSSGGTGGTMVTEDTYTISNCPAVNASKNGTSVTKSTILGNVPSYVGCELSGKTGKISGYSYSGSISEGNKMVLFVASTDEGSYEWGTWPYDIATLTNITNLSSVGQIEMRDGYNNTQKIITKLVETGETNKAAQKCNSKGTGWYLPSIEEITQLYCYSNYASNTYADCANKGFTYVGLSLNYTTAQYYFSSNEQSGSQARAIRYSDGYRLAETKQNAYVIRCVNRF